ncbi:MAG: AAA family ATPase [Pseudomonadales bacterium]|nr:AAA family ATPase [Pseudomonadales bacterium]
MFFSYDFIKDAYSGLIKLDPSDGKSRKEKVSGLRYLIATSQLLRQENSNNINLSVGSELREQFIDAVGNVVSLNDEGLYSKDFSNELDTKKGFGVGSNFLTTRLANSRSQDIRYPGRPANLLALKQEHASILENASQTLTDSYGIGNIKPELCIWLLRAEEFTASSETISSSDLLLLLESKLNEKYTSEVVSAIKPTNDELSSFLNDASSVHFVVDKPDYSDIVSMPEAVAEAPVARVLINDLSDDDKILSIVQQLLARGAKGILFSGPPGTSKTWYALKVALKIINGDDTQLERVQFHPSFTYEDFIEGLVSTGSASGSDPMFKPKDKVFLNLCEKARKDTDNLYILIIDEFSRGDPSKIFGELLTYIEPDYRDIEFRLPYSEKLISIPQNVVIFATMNPYDKSVVDLDSAMERRFDVIEFLPSVHILRSLLSSGGVEGQDLGKVIEFFNTANRLSPHGFGHTYFNGVKEEIDFILLWNHKLKFIFEKMFRFKDDAYEEVRLSYINIISENKKDDIK